MVRNYLPSFPTSFIGRTEEIAELSQLLDNPDCRLLTLVGPGGIGKTRLAVEVARCKFGDFADGVYFVPLQPVQTADQILSTVIDSLPLQVTDNSWQRLLDYLSEKRLLLIVDNFEHVMTGVGLIDDILAAAPQVTLVVTSREVLHLHGEWVWRVAGLTYPGRGENLNGDTYSALDLFTQSARRLRSDSRLEHERHQIGRICQLVEGMPLGIELAAGWTTVLTCAEIVAEIEGSLKFLMSDARNLPERHRSMQAVFDHSWRLLTDEEQRVMARFSVFRGGCTREAAERITGARLPMLASLVAKSMLRHDPERGRHDVQELMRQYAEEQLIASGDTDAAQDAHRDYYAHFMEQRAPEVKGRRQLGALDEIEADWNNIRAAWTRALAQRNWDVVGQMMETLHLFCDMRSRYADGDLLFQQALDALEPCDGEIRHPRWGELLVRAAEVIQLPESDQWRRSMVLLDRAEHEAKIGDDPLYFWVRGKAFDVMYYNLHDGPGLAGLPFLEASLSSFLKQNTHYYVVRTLRSLSFLFLRLWSIDRSEYADKFIEYNQQHLDLAKRIGDETGTAHALYYMASDAWQRRQFDVSEQYLLEADAIWRKMGDEKSHNVIRYNLGKIAFHRGDFEQAKHLLTEAASIASEVNYLSVQHEARERLGAIAYFEGDYERGQKLLAELPPGERLLFGRMVAAAAEGHFDLVRRYLRDTFNWLRSNSLSDIHPTRFFPIAAILLAKTDEPVKAVELLARQASDEIPMGFFDRWELLTQVHNDLEQRLGADAFEAAWQHGEKLSAQLLVSQLLDYLDEESDAVLAAANNQLDHPLTSRELEVLVLVAAGRSNRQIAEELVISVNTVKRYVYDICQKLDAQNRTEAANHARILKLIQ